MNNVLVILLILSILLIGGFLGFWLGLSLMFGKQDDLLHRTMNKIFHKGIKKSND